MTISGGADRFETRRSCAESGRRISFEGSLKRVLIALACSVLGVKARRFVGRLLRGSALVGRDSGPGSDMVMSWRARLG